MASSRTKIQEIVVSGLILIDLGLIVLLKSLSDILNTTIFLEPIKPLLIVIFILTIVLIWLFSRKNRQIIKCIEDNLINVGAIIKVNNDLSITPKIKIRNDLITIYVSNPTIRHKIETNQDILNSFLPTGLIVSDVFFSKDEKRFFIKFKDINQNSRYIFNSLPEFKKVAEQLPPDTLILDKDHSINLREQPHLLISGTTGSGKSYYATFLVSMCLYKGFEVDICDYKQSYVVFENVCKVSFTIEEIHSRLIQIREELHQRQQEMKKYLKDNPNAIASDYGFKTHVIFIEEFMSVMNSGADKATLSTITKILLEITAIGRALSFHLVLITQVASSTNLDTSIRSNLVPMVLGMATKTIYETSFGIKSVPNISTKFEKGGGLAKFDINLVRVACPTLHFPLSELYRVGNTQSVEKTLLLDKLDNNMPYES